MLASPKKTCENDLEAVVMALSALDGCEGAVREFIAGPGLTGYSASTFATAKTGLETVRAQSGEELSKRRAEVELVTARQQHKRIAGEKAELSDLFDNHLRFLLAGSEAASEQALQRLEAAAKSAGVTDTLLRVLPLALRRTPQERSTLETNAVDMLLEHLEAHAQAKDQQMAASVARLRDAQRACEASVKEDLSTLLCRQTLAEDELAKADAVLAALQRLSAQQVDAAH